MSLTDKKQEPDSPLQMPGDGTVKTFPIVEVITKKQREQARSALKRCITQFTINTHLLRFLNAYGYVPPWKSATLGEVPHPKPTNVNTCAAAWCVIQFFSDKNNVDFSDGNMELMQFVIKDYEPENGFIWAAAMVLQECIALEVSEYADKNKELLSQHAANAEANGKTTSGGSESEASLKAKKGKNKLLASFKQALQEKKRSEMGLASKTPLAKLTPEEAAKKPAPKASKPLFKPPIAYQLERLNPATGSGDEKEFLSIQDIVKLTDATLMDDLVRKLVQAFIKQTLEAMGRTDVLITQAFYESVQPIALKNLPSIRNLLGIASTFVKLYKEKLAQDGKDMAPWKQEAEANLPASASSSVASGNEYGSMTSDSKVADMSEYGAPVKSKAEVSGDEMEIEDDDVTDTKIEVTGWSGFGVGGEAAIPGIQSDATEAANGEYGSRAEVDEEGEAASALEKMRKARENATNVDERIAAIADESRASGDSAGALEGENDESIVFKKSTATNFEEVSLQDEQNNTTPSGDEKVSFSAKKSVVARTNKLLQAFKQQKSSSSSKSACTSRQKVTASDILARLQTKDKSASPVASSAASIAASEVAAADASDVIATASASLEIRNVSTPPRDDSEDLYQQALSKDSDTVNIAMDTSPERRQRDTDAFDYDDVADTTSEVPEPTQPAPLPEEAPPPSETAPDVSS